MIDFLHVVVVVAQSTGEFLPVDVLVLRDVSEGAVLPRAARGPPEEALLLAQTATARKTTRHFTDKSQGCISELRGLKLGLYLKMENKKLNRTEKVT